MAQQNGFKNTAIDYYRYFVNYGQKLRSFSGGGVKDGLRIAILCIVTMSPGLTVHANDFTKPLCRNFTKLHSEKTLYQYGYLTERSRRMAR